MTTQTSLDGGFAFSYQGPGTGVRLRATKEGYLPGNLGQLGPADNVGAAFNLARGAQVAGMVIRLWPTGIIQGKVTDERGEPVAGASVLALTRMSVGGVPQWWRAGVPRRTDDRGEYRLDQLNPGDYVVAVRPQPNVVNGMVPVPAFNPGVWSAAAAAPVRVSGDTLSVDVRIAPPSRSRNVSGRLVGANSSTLGMLVRLSGIDSSGATTGFEEFSARADADGLFTFPRVPVGVYRLRVSEFPKMEVSPYTVSGDFYRMLTGYIGPGPRAADTSVLPELPAEPTLVADEHLMVDDALRGSITIPLRSAPRIRGRVVFEGQRPPPGPGELVTIPVVIRPADGGQSFDLDDKPIPQARIERDSSFTSPGLPPGEYVIGAMTGIKAISGWHIAAIERGGRDVMGKPLRLETSDISDVVVTFMDRPTEIAGTVSGRRPEAPLDVRVIVFPRNPAERHHYWANPSPRRVAQGFPDLTGAFRVRVPAGEYLAAAVTSDLPALWMAPEYLQRLEARAAPVRVGRGEQATANVTAVAVPVR